MYHRHSGGPRGLESFFPPFALSLHCWSCTFLEIHHDVCWCREGTLHQVMEYVNQSLCEISPDPACVVQNWLCEIYPNLLDAKDHSWCETPLGLFVTTIRAYQ